jgi:hypothetical protein
MELDMLDELCFRVSGPRDEYSSGIRNGVCHALKEIVVLRRVAAADAVGLMVNVASRMLWMQHDAIDLCNVEMKDARFAVVDPNDGVIVAGHVCLLSRMAVSQELMTPPEWHQLHCSRSELRL